MPRYSFCNTTKILDVRCAMYISHLQRHCDRHRDDSLLPVDPDLKDCETAPRPDFFSQCSSDSLRQPQSQPQLPGLRSCSWTFRDSTAPVSPNLIYLSSWNHLMYRRANMNIKVPSAPVRQVGLFNLLRTTDWGSPNTRFRVGDRYIRDFSVRSDLNADIGLAASIWQINMGKGEENSDSPTYGSRFAIWGETSFSDLHRMDLMNQTFWSRNTL